MQTVIDTSTYDDQYLPNMPQVDFQMENQISNACLMIHTSIKTGEQKVPSTILSMAKGVAFITILKVGFMVTGRYGSGVVLSRLPNGCWSAPSAITMSGVGWGIQVGTEVSDVLLVLTSDSAIEAFKSTGQLTVGAELGVSVGPVGKSLETDVTIGNKGAAHAFSYAASHGLYAGVSLEACVIAQAKGVNRAFYGERAHASALLAGDIAMPLGAEPLYKALDLLEYDGSPPADREANRFIGYEKTRGALSSQASALGGEGGGARIPQTLTQTQTSVWPPAAAAATATTSVGSTGEPAAKIDYDTLGQVARFASDNPAVASAAVSMMTGSSSGGTGSNSSSDTGVGNT
jgi:lipid-binding SYLF domain-containing protein